LHESLLVSKGAKATVTNFIYRRFEEFIDLRQSSPILKTPLLEAPVAVR